MLHHVTERFTIKAADYVNVPIYESSPITIQEGQTILEIQGLSQKEIQQAILAYVRLLGWAGSNTAQQSGFVSDLEDALPEVKSRIAKDLAAQEQLA